MPRGQSPVYQTRRRCRHGMDRPGRESDKGAVIAITVMTALDFSPREGPGLTPAACSQALACPLPNVKAGPRRRRSACRRHGAVAAPSLWLELGSRYQHHGVPSGLRCLCECAVARGVCSVVVLDMIVVLGALTAVGIIATPVDASLLRRMPSAVRRGRFYYCTPPEWPAGLPLSTTAPGHVLPMLGRMLLVRLTRNWRWYRQQPRRAEPELATRIGGTGKTDYTQFQTLSSQACTTTGI
jgi:hypothetical protein